MSILGSLLKSAVRGTFQDHKKYADYEKEIAAKRAADDASKSAKETGLTVDEAEGLIEESRDSAIAETQEKTNKQQHKIVLFILVFFVCVFVFGGGPDPSGY
ncbi:MAG: hypothetical protein VYE70_03615 [Candidatus Thermoplasmatota archaeon]|nr:hypothetical protein [Candidatus Thermoplasmatota archaeon]